MENKFYLTKEGLKKLQKEYQDLKKIKFAKTMGETPAALHSEDLNPEYLSFREDLSFLETRIVELTNVLKNAETIKRPRKSERDMISLGATVTLQEADGQINEFMIVGTLEANPGEGKISSASPIGKTLLGHRKGEEVVITSPIKVVYKIKDVKYHSI
jgi:transcription elongation factor GreA